VEGIDTGSEAVRFIELGAVLLVLGLLSRFASRISLSAVPLFLLAGLFFGKGGVDPLEETSSFVTFAGQIGAVLLLLLLGLEYGPRELVMTGREHWRTGIIDLVLNALPGALVGWLLGWGLVGIIAMAGVTYVSSSGIMSQLVRDMRWRTNSETAPVVSVLVLEDLVMAPYLPILVVVVGGGGLIAGLTGALIGLLVVGVVFVIGIRRPRALSRIVGNRDPVALMLQVLGLALLAAGAAELWGFSGAVAAFLVGLLLTGQVAEVARTRLDPLRDLFAALFFLAIGLATDPHEIPGVLPIALGLAIVTIATKFVVGRLAAANSSNPRKSGLRAGSLLSARGEFSVVVAGIAAASPVLPPSFTALVTTYVLITAIAAPVFARIVQARFETAPVPA
jgi:CPA2 family monovalent cation:H+ antiporter-2